uniref:Uncharacterized protein n=1 Tax=viral metagenome TaxID=1070528 RepID=A0A6C0LLW0_9ZZZZ
MPENAGKYSDKFCYQIGRQWRAAIKIIRHERPPMMTK